MRRVVFALLCCAVAAVAAQELSEAVEHQLLTGDDLRFAEAAQCPCALVVCVQATCPPCPCARRASPSVAGVSAAAEEAAAAAAAAKQVPAVTHDVKVTGVDAAVAANNAAETAEQARTVAEEQRRAAELERVENAANVAASHEAQDKRFKAHLLRMKAERRHKKQQQRAHVKFLAEQARVADQVNGRVKAAQANLDAQLAQDWTSADLASSASRNSSLKVLVDETRHNQKMAAEYRATTPSDAPVQQQRAQLEAEAAKWRAEREARENLVVAERDQAEAKRVQELEKTLDEENKQDTEERRAYAAKYKAEGEEKLRQRAAQLAALKQKFEEEEARKKAERDADAVKHAQAFQAAQLAQLNEERRQKREVNAQLKADLAKEGARKKQHLTQLHKKLADHSAARKKATQDLVAAGF